MIRTFDVPVRLLTRRFYEKTRSKAVELIGDLSGVRSVYQFGSASVPGNSDIDLMIVIEPDARAARSLFRTFETRFTTAEKFVIYQHDPLVTGSAIAPYINYVRGCTHLTHLWGEDFDFDLNLDYHTRLYILIELLTQYYPRIFFDRNRDTRLRLQHINAFRFPSTEYQELRLGMGLPAFPSESAIPKTIAENDSLRRDYRNFSTERVDSLLLDMETQLIEASMGMINSIDAYLCNILPDRVTIGTLRVLDRLFVDGPHPNGLGLSLLGRSFDLWMYPRSFHAFFGGTLKGSLGVAVNDRNEILTAYCGFIDNHVSGRGLYYPWWRRQEGTRARTVRTAMAWLHHVRAPQ